MPTHAEPGRSAGARSPWRPGRTVDCFVSYRSDAEQQARRIGGWLEAAGLSTVVQTFDFLPGDDFARLIDDALTACHRLVALFTPSYFTSMWCRDEWTQAVLRRKLISVEVEPCGLGGPMAKSVDVDLTCLDPGSARERLVAVVQELLVTPRPAPRALSGDELREAQQNSPWRGDAELWSHPQLRPRPEHITAASSHEARRIGQRRLESGDY
jgi:hypothetical protein